MIAYFPKFYPDELLYSTIARYCDHSGFLAFKYAANELFINPSMRVDREFMKNLNEDCISVLERQLPLKAVLEQHTMMPYYTRFYDMTRKQTIRVSMLKQNQDCNKLVGMPQNRTKRKRYMRLCPACIENDREKYAECYFHRVHQMWNVNICPEHGCKLIETDIPLDVSGASVAFSAEQSANHITYEKHICDNSLEITYAIHNQSLLQLSSDIDLSRIADFICQKLIGTKYMSARGEHRYFSRLYEDMKEYYADTGIMDNVQKEHIQQMLMGKRLLFHEIVAVLLFLNISMDELSELNVSELTPEQQFDKKVSALKKQGFSRNEIARQFKVSTSVIDYAIEEKVAKCVKRQRNRTNVVDWNEKDVLYFPQTKRIVDRLLSDIANRPQNISMYKIRKELGIPQHWLEQMPTCRKYVLEHCMSQEELDTRAVAWAVQKIQDSGEQIRLWRINQIIKIKLERVISVVIKHPELFDEADRDVLRNEIEMRQF